MVVANDMIMKTNEITCCEHPHITSGYYALDLLSSRVCSVFRSCAALRAPGIEAAWPRPCVASAKQGLGSREPVRHRRGAPISNRSSNPKTRRHPLKQQWRGQ
jgi:hypothetical protein